MQKQIAAILKVLTLAERVKLKPVIVILPIAGRKALLNIAGGCR
ncbi:MAG: hypothetical protein ABI691_06690 [Ginsengibacter sp.]